MSIEVERDICGDDQESSFMNATLQSGPPGFEFSIAMVVDVPLIGVYDQDTLDTYLRDVFHTIAGNPRVHICIQMGKEGDGEPNVPD